MDERREFMLDVQQGGGVPVRQFCELTNVIANAAPGQLRVTVEPYPGKPSEEYELRVSGRDRMFLEALAEFLASVGSISGAKVFDPSSPELPPKRDAENCANAQELRGEPVHCGHCHDINEGYKFLPYWKPRDSEQR